MVQTITRIWSRLASSVARRRWERRARKGTYHMDPLTGLLTRQGLLSVLETKSQSRDQQWLLLLVNISRFRTVNLTLGSQIGDRVLRFYAERLRVHVPGVEAVARVGGDEFALLARCDDGMSRLGLVHAVRAAMEDPVRVDEWRHVELGCAIGIARLAGIGHDFSLHALQHAETALRAARDQGGGEDTEYTDQLERTCQRSYFVENELPRAIAQGELTLFLQSQVDPAGEVMGAECLLRWLHPTLGLIAPVEFLPIAEKSDLIIKLGDWVLEEACRLVLRLSANGCARRLSVNVSPRQFMCSDFVPRLQALVESTGVDPRWLTLEITEGMAITQVDVVVQAMQRLRKLGFGLSLDDFGTGYSSLSYLKRLPVHEVKLDKQFIDYAPQSESDEAVVRAVLLVAKSLGIQVIAEGVETQAQAVLLSRIGEFGRQGYLYGRPIPSEMWIDKMRVQKAGVN